MPGFAKFKLRQRMVDCQIHIFLAAFLVACFLAATTTAQNANVAAGNLHTVLLKSNGSVWTTGNNEYGQLGDKTFVNKNVFTQVMSGLAKSVSAAKSQTFVLKQDGTVWAAGYNNYGQLGIGSTADKFNTFVKASITDVESVAAGNHLTIALKKDGSVWSAGQLGKRSSTFQKVMDGDAKAIAAGHEHALVLKTDGSVWTMGDNTFGQLGDKSTKASSVFKMVISGGVTAVFASDSHSMVIKSDGTVWATGQNNYGSHGDGTRFDSSKFVQSILPQNVQTLSIGYLHTIALMSDGSVQATGNNKYGQLGDTTTTTRNKFREVISSENFGVKYIAAGRYHTVVINANGTISSTGSNSDGQLGDSSDERTIFKQIYTTAMNCPMGFFNAEGKKITINDPMAGTKITIKDPFTGKTKTIEAPSTQTSFRLPPSCKPCPDGHFKDFETVDATKVDACKPHKVCGDDQWKQIVGTAFQDNKCSDCPSDSLCDGTKATGNANLCIFDIITALVALKWSHNHLRS